jgi:agmatine deiminase
MQIKLIEAPAYYGLNEFDGTPKDAGFYFPAEWKAHSATWLSWPHNTDTWPGRIKHIYSAYCEFVRVLSLSERVNINVGSVELAKSAFTRIAQYGAELDNIFFYLNPTNDAWCRDHGPAFLVNKDPSKTKILVDWDYNAWGEKYPPFDLDNEIPSRIAAQLDLEVSKPGIVMEGGSVDFNGSGVLITSEKCLLNPNRNPGFSKSGIEQKLRDFYGVEEVLWVKDGIEGDDTDGHIDDTARFVNEAAVVAMVEKDTSDSNHRPLNENLETLKQLKIKDKELDVIEIEMPEPIYFHGQRLPASYANFYISNAHVILPIFGCSNDDQAIEILKDCFPEREIVGINSRELIWGFGSFHCLSQQEPF